MSMKLLTQELEVIDDALLQLEERRDSVVQALEACRERRQSLSNLIRFPRSSYITVMDGTDEEWNKRPAFSET